MRLTISSQIQSETLKSLSLCQLKTSSQFKAEELLLLGELSADNLKLTKKSKSLDLPIQRNQLLPELKCSIRSWMTHRPETMQEFCFEELRKKTFKEDRF